MVRQTLLLHNVTRSTKLQGTQQVEEHGLSFTRKPTFSSPAGCFLDNENNRLFNNFIVFTRQYKNEEKLGHYFFSIILR